MDLHRLKCFIAVAEELHFGRAAGVHLTQPAVSLQIRGLEQELGVQLFFRTNRRVTLTDVGIEFLAHAHDLLAHSDEIVRTIRRSDSKRPAKLVIGATPPAVYCLGAAIVESLRRLLPSTEVVLKALTTEQQEEALIVGHIQAGIVHPPMAEKNIRLLPVGSARFMLAIPQAHRLAGTEALALSELRGERIIMFPRAISPWIYDKIIGACLRAGFSAQVTMEATPAQTIIGLVAASQGIGFVAEPFVALAPSTVMFRPIAGETFELEFAIARTPGLPKPVSDALDAMAAGGDLQKCLLRPGATPDSMRRKRRTC